MASSCARSAVERTRVVVESLRWAELHRVDEDAAQAAVAQRLAFFDQRHVPGVQVAHGRDEGDRLIVIFPVLHVLAQFGDAGCLVHLVPFQDYICAGWQITAFAREPRPGAKVDKLSERAMITVKVHQSLRKNSASCRENWRRFHFLHVAADRAVDTGLALHEVFRKFRFLADGNVEHILQYENLAVDVGPGANADHRDIERRGDFRGQVCRHAFQQQQIGAGLLQVFCRGQHTFGGAFRLALHAVTAHLVDHLRLQAEMGATGDAEARQGFDRFQLRFAAFQLDHLRPGSALNSSLALSSACWVELSEPKGMSSISMALFSPFGYRPAVVGDFGQRDRNRGVVPLDDHTQRIADQHHLDAAIFDQPRETVIVGGQAGEIFHPAASAWRAAGW